jgi:hypothetical protein
MRSRSVPRAMEPSALTDPEVSARRISRQSRPQTSLWLGGALLPIIVASGVSYNMLLSLGRPSVAGIPVSPVDASVVIGLAATLLFGPRPSRAALNPVIVTAAALIILGTVVGILEKNDPYYLLRDMRSGTYFLVGAYLTSVVSTQPSEARVALKWMTLAVLVASAFQWLRFLSGLNYGAVALSGSASALRDVSIFQYTYVFSFGAIASRLGTTRRLMPDTAATAVLFIGSMSAGLILTRSAWLAFALVGLSAAIVPVARARFLGSRILVAASAVAIPWVVLSAMNSPVASAPLQRLDPPPILGSPALSSPPTAQGDDSLWSHVVALGSRIESLSARFEVADAAVDEMSKASASQEPTVWIVGLGFGHAFATFTYHYGQTVTGITDLEVVPIHFLWKTGLLGLALVGLAVLWRLSSAWTAARRRGWDSDECFWLITLIPILVVGSMTGLSAAPFSMVIGAWLCLRFDAVGSEQLTPMQVDTPMKDQSMGRRAGSIGSALQVQAP